MLTIKKIVLCCSLFFAWAAVRCQEPGCRLRISLLTCGPGEDLYSIWGHTGVRVIDSSRGIDTVFNYGTFDDSDPLFYVKFTRGIMQYAVTPYSFGNFMLEYQYFRRSVTEQVLDMDCTAKTKLSDALWNNVKEQNRYYPYHFYADNCTTRARDIIINNLGGRTRFKDIRPQPGRSTYRQLIHEYMKTSSQAWNRFGIDVLLGNHLDEPMDNKQAMFLPDYLLKAFDSASLNGHPLVAEVHLLLPDGQPDASTLFTPITTFSIVLLAMIGLSFLKNKTMHKAAGVLDSLFFLFTGLLGILMLALWLGRIDNVCRNNYNLLWALPTHAVIAFAVGSRKNWVRLYWLFTVILNLLLLIAWNWLPQEMNSSVLLVIIILLFRSLARYRKFKSA